MQCNDKLSIVATIRTLKVFDIKGEKVLHYSQLFNIWFYSISFWQYYIHILFVSGTTRFVFNSVSKTTIRTPLIDSVKAERSSFWNTRTTTLIYRLFYWRIRVLPSCALNSAVFYIKNHMHDKVGRMHLVFHDHDNLVSLCTKLRKCLCNSLNPWTKSKVIYTMW